MKLVIYKHFKINFQFNLGAYFCLQKYRGFLQKLQKNVFFFKIFSWKISHFFKIFLSYPGYAIFHLFFGSLTNQSHELRIYDPRAVQRRPVKRVEWGNHPITAVLSLDQIGNKYAVGNARGKLAMIDLRNPKKLRSFKGAAGKQSNFKRINLFEFLLKKMKILI